MDNKKRIVWYSAVARKILIGLIDTPNGYSLRLSHKLNITYCSIVKVRNILEKEKLIKTKKNGRIRTIELTPKGKLVALKLKEINMILNRNEK